MEKAEHDLSEIVTYFTDILCNPKAADSFLEEFLEEKENIADNPYMYPLSNDLFYQSFRKSSRFFHIFDMGNPPETFSIYIISTDLFK